MTIDPSYPSQWWAFAICACIFTLCALIVYRACGRNWAWCPRDHPYSPIESSVGKNRDEAVKQKTDMSYEAAAHAPNASTSKRTVLKTVLRLGEPANVHSQDDPRAADHAVISVSSFHASHNSQYQSLYVNDFNAMPDYSPRGSSIAGESDVESETMSYGEQERIEIMKEMCMAAQPHFNPPLTEEDSSTDYSSLDERA